MQLSKLLEFNQNDIDVSYPKSLNELEIKAITADSRLVKPGSLFAALKGIKQDGKQFIEQAINNGAVAVLSDEPENTPENVGVIVTDNPRKTLALMAAKFYDAQPNLIAGVTGTNGKTSVASFTQQIWELMDLSSVSLGTLGIHGSGFVTKGGMTTPDPIALHAALGDIKAAGVEHVAIECSSHGLDQHRLDGVKLKAAAFTNLTRDHLDYHGDMDTYALAKSRIFCLLDDNGIAVINADDVYASTMEQQAKIYDRKVVTFGKNGNDVIVKNHQAHAKGQLISLEINQKKYDIDLSLIGMFQGYNVITALAIVIADKINDQKFVDDVIKKLPELKGVPGRLELIDGHPGDVPIFVDYAHTPSALEEVLKAVRPHTEKEIICVFGCGGNRDTGKRAMMGQVANDLADTVIITDDNPRFEDSTEIRTQIRATVPDAYDIADRRQAISKAISIAKPGDVVVIAGKGHESGQTVGSETVEFDDRVETKEAIKDLIKS